MMAVDERRRSELYGRLEAVVGSEAAVTMFELLPPPHSDVATTADIDRLEARIDVMERRFDDRFDGFRTEMMAAWRRDLLLHSTGQFLAVVAAVGVLLGFG